MKNIRNSLTKQLLSIAILTSIYSIGSAQSGNYFAGTLTGSGNTGSQNSAIGFLSLYSSNSGWYNVGLGYKTLYTNSYGNANSALGCRALEVNTTGFSNTAIGFIALNFNTTGNSNTAVGSYALNSNTTGNNNVAIGMYSGSGSSNSNCTFIGYSSFATINGLSNATSIGYSAKVDASNKVRIGNNAVTSIGGQVSWTTLSDRRLKTNITESKLGLNFIVNLNPVTYNYKEEGQKDILYTGLIAQEVDEAATKEGVAFSGVDKNGEYWGIRYGDLTVPLIKAVQELNETLKSENEKMKMEIAELRNEISSGSAERTSKLNTYSTNKLEQNSPNPFSESTTIQYSVNPGAFSAHLVIRNLNGVAMQQINLEKTTSGNATIQASLLAQGTYTYTLEVDGRTIDTKIMVITR